MGAGALPLAGGVMGGTLAATSGASAATSSVASAVGNTVQQLDPTKSIRSDEHLLTGTTADKVRAAALAKYPGATVQRVETDSDGVYETHIVTSSGELIVQVDKNFDVTGTESGGRGGRHGDGDGTVRRGRGPARPDAQSRQAGSQQLCVTVAGLLLS